MDDDVNLCPSLCVSAPCSQLYSPPCSILLTCSPPTTTTNTTTTTTTTDSSASTTPQKVLALAGNVTAISAGSFASTCALLDGGSVKCWGNNELGQLGDGTTTNRGTPVKVQGLEKVEVTQIAVGYRFAVALTSTGRVYAWGENGDYQLGDYTTTDRYTAVEVEVIPEQYAVTSASAGEKHVCVGTLDDAFLCYGDGSYGCFGNGVSTAASSTVYVPRGQGWGVGSESGLGCGKRES